MGVLQEWEEEGDALLVAATRFQIAWRTSERLWIRLTTAHGQHETQGNLFEEAVGFDGSKAVMMNNRHYIKMYFTHNQVLQLLTELETEDLAKGVLKVTSGLRDCSAIEAQRFQKVPPIPQDLKIAGFARCNLGEKFKTGFVIEYFEVGLFASCKLNRVTVCKNVARDICAKKTPLYLRGQLSDAFEWILESVRTTISQEDQALAFQEQKLAKELIPVGEDLRDTFLMALWLSKIEQSVAGVPVKRTKSGPGKASA